MSRAKIFLINESIMKSETILNDNVGSEFIAPSIEAAQDMYLQQLIGTELIEKLYDLIRNDTIASPENAEYKTLLDDYITNYLKYKVLADITIPLAFKYRNNGVMQSNTDHYSNSTLRDATMVQSHYEMRANFYAERLTKYLMSKDFPEYRSVRTSADMMANPDAYQTNIVL